MRICVPAGRLDHGQEFTAVEVGPSAATWLLQRPLMGAPALPGMHTDAYAPVPEPSIRTGVRTMSLAAMNLMPKKEK